MHRKPKLSAFYLILLLALACTTCGQPSNTDTTHRVVIISIDGMADWMLDYLLENGQLPNIKRVLSHGVAAEAAYTTLPAKTAVGHAAIWTGTDPSHNGIQSNSIIAKPFEDRTVLDHISGYDATGLQTEPIWVTAARQGKKAVVVQATQCQPFEYFFGEYARFSAPRENLLIFDGYGIPPLQADLIKPDAEMESADDWRNLPHTAGNFRSFSKTIGDVVFYFLFYDDSADPVEGLDTLRICSTEDADANLATLKPRPPDPDSADAFSPPIDLTVNSLPMKLYFRLFSLKPDGSDFTLFHSQAHYYRSTNPEEESRMNDYSGGFVGNAASRIYSRGFFGPSVFDGGDGTAEKEFLESVRLSVERFSAAMKFALENYDYDLLVGYLPYPDEFNHEWLGYIAESSGGFDQPNGKKITPFLLKGYLLVDEYVGTVFDNMPEGTVLLVVSDHGFTGVNKLFFPNVVLKRAGLLFTDDDGMIDLTKSRAVYYPFGDDLIFINTTEFKEGIVPLKKKGEILAEVERAMLAVKDEEGNRIVERVIYPATESELGMDGPYAAHLYIKLAPGYGNDESPVGDEMIRNLEAPRGDHFGDPRERLMKSIFLASRKNGKIDVELGLVRGIDFAPTISSLLGIEPLPQATGRSIQGLVHTLLEAEPK